MTSEEDVSVTGSPCLSRRRLGSFSGDQLMREDTYSPGKTNFTFVLEDNYTKQNSQTTIR